MAGKSLVNQRLIHQIYQCSPPSTLRAIWWLVTATLDQYSLIEHTEQNLLYQGMQDVYNKTVQHCGFILSQKLCSYLSVGYSFIEWPWCQAHVMLSTTGSITNTNVVLVTTSDDQQQSWMQLLIKILILHWYMFT